MKCSNEHCEGKVARGKHSDLCDDCVAAAQNVDAIPSDEKGQKLVVCELLAYLSSAMQESSKDMLKKSVLSFYSDEEVSTAKDILWNSYTEDMLGKKIRRNNGERSSKEKNVEDIVDAVLLIDQNRKQWEIVIFCAVDLKRIPKFSPEELDVVSVVDRLALIEKQMCDMKTLTSSHTAQLAGVVAEVAELRKPKFPMPPPPPMPMFPMPRPQGPLHGGAPPSTHQAVVTPGGTGRGFGGNTKKQTPEVIVINGDIPGDGVEKGKITAAAPGAASGGSSSGTSGGARKRTHRWFDSGPAPSAEEVQKLYQDLPPGFRYPASFAKKLRVIGKGKPENSKIHGAPKQRILFVENVSNSTEDSDMKDFVSSIVPIEDFKRASVDAASRKSFRFKVDDKDACKLLDPEIWPEGIGCRLWQFRGKPQNGTQATPT